MRVLKGRRGNEGRYEEREEEENGKIECIHVVVNVERVKKKEEDDF